MMKAFFMRTGFLFTVLFLFPLLLPAQPRGARKTGAANPLGMTEPVIAEGRQLYNRSCTMCHGIDGELGDRAPALKGARRFARSRDEDLYDAIKNGIKGTLMPASPLPENDVWKIVAYIRSMRASAFDAPLEGDPEKGRAVFWEQAGCGGCHMIQGRGGLLGPDLSSVGGQRTALALREALTKPRPHIPPGYRPAKVFTAAGEMVEGMIKNEHNFSLQMLSRDGRLRLFTAEEIRHIEYGERSLMPTDWEQRLTPEQFKNLLAFLSRQAAARIKQQSLAEEDLGR